MTVSCYNIYRIQCGIQLIQGLFAAKPNRIFIVLCIVTDARKITWVAIASKMLTVISPKGKLAVKVIVC